MTNQLKNKIMRRVYAIWLLKKVFSLAVIRASIFSLLMVEFIREVSVINVIHNLPAKTDIISDLNYLSSAYIGTELTVQICLVVMAVILFWFLTDRIIKHTPNHIGMVGSRL